MINLMSLVNVSETTTGTLDSCIVLKYPNPSTSLRVHSDDEQLIDQNASICTYSLGSTRTIEFYSKSGKSKLVTSHSMAQDSLLVMRPGCQQELLHCVRAEKKSGCKVFGKV